METWLLLLKDSRCRLPIEFNSVYARRRKHEIQKHSGIFSPHKHVVICHQGTSMGGQASRHPPRLHCCQPCAAGANTTPPDAEANRQAGHRWLGSPEHIHKCVRVRSSTNSHVLQEETMHVSIPIGQRPSCDCSESAAV